MFTFFPAGEGGPLPMGMRNPCVLEWDTRIGRITLLVDQANPLYLFISIDGEPRKCVDLAPFHLAFADRRETLEFLEKIRDSDFTADLIREEESLDTGWDAL
ncbi:MAG TPA: hypothetical protein PK360_11645 [bacterium]|nr:hypothetical protein [bacterium]